MYTIFYVHVFITSLVLNMCVCWCANCILVFNILLLICILIGFTCPRYRVNNKGYHRNMYVVILRENGVWVVTDTCM